MCIFAHSANEWEWSSTCIRNIESDIGHILSRPPKCKLCSDEAFFILIEKNTHKACRKEYLKKTSAEDHHEFSEWHKNHMTSFMKYEVCPMDKTIHYLFIDSKCKKLEGINKKKDEKNTPKSKHTNFEILSWKECFREKTFFQQSIRLGIRYLLHLQKIQ